MVLCSHIALWFDVPENRLRTDNAVHLGPGDTVPSDYQKNETKLFALLLGSGFTLIAYPGGAVITEC